MKKTIVAFVLLVLPALSLASEAGYPLQRAPLDLHNKASLQKGAKLFVNYCMGCHSLEHQRYNRMARDIGLTDDQVKANPVSYTHLDVYKRQSLMRPNSATTAPRPAPTESLRR